MRVPLFIETVEGPKFPELQICRKIAAHLCKQGIAPLPFANSMDQLVSVLHTLKKMQRWPALVIVNTHWAEEILRDLDALTGDTPILLFHRELDAPIKPGDSDILLGLRDADSRALALYTYGTKIVDSAAESASIQIVRYLSSGEFRHIESLDRRRKKPLVY